MNMVVTTARADQHTSGEDPRKQRSRTRLLDAATTLLADGGVDAVTIDAVTKLANVARATLYRHFDSGTELLAAAFARLLPSVPEMSGEGDLRAQLLELLTNQAKIIESVPVQVTAMCWLGLGPDLTGYSSAQSLAGGQQEMRSLRQMIVEQYRDAFDRVLRTPAAVEELGEYDYDVALTQLVGPLVLTKLATFTPLGETACAQIVDDFLIARRSRTRLFGV